MTNAILQNKNSKKAGGIVYQSSSSLPLSPSVEANGRCLIPILRIPKLFVLGRNWSKPVYLVPNPAPPELYSFGEPSADVVPVFKEDAPYLRNPG